MIVVILWLMIFCVCRVCIGVLYYVYFILWLFYRFCSVWIGWWCFIKVWCLCLMKWVSFWFIWYLWKFLILNLLFIGIVILIMMKEFVGFVSLLLRCCIVVDFVLKLFVVLVGLIICVIVVIVSWVRCWLSYFVLGYYFDFFYILLFWIWLLLYG